MIFLVGISEFSGKIEIHYSSTFIHNIIQTTFSNIQTNLNSIFNVQYSASTPEDLVPTNANFFMAIQVNSSDIK